MGKLSLLSGGLFILPIAITIAVLVAVENYQVSRGQIGLGPLTSSDGIQINTYCQKALGVAPAPGRYICKFSCTCVSSYQQQAHLAATSTPYPVFQPLSAANFTTFERYRPGWQ